MTDPTGYETRLAHAALEYIEPGSVIAVGAGSVCDHFVTELQHVRSRIDAVVACSGPKLARLRDCDLPVTSLNDIDAVDILVATADEVTRRGQLIRSNTGFFTQEKLAAAVAKRYLCLVGRAQLVDYLGKAPIPIEVLPMVRNHVSRELRTMGATPGLRPQYRTEHGNAVIDAHDLHILEPAKLEWQLRVLPGVVESGPVCAQARRHRSYRSARQNRSVRLTGQTLRAASCPASAEPPDCRLASASHESRSDRRLPR